MKKHRNTHPVCMLNVSTQRAFVQGKLGSSRYACETWRKNCAHIHRLVFTRLLTALHGDIILILRKHMSCTDQ